MQRSLDMTLLIQEESKTRSKIAVLSIWLLDHNQKGRTHAQKIPRGLPLQPGDIGIHLRTSTHRVQKITLNSMELEFQAVLSHPTWMLETTLVSSERGILNCKANSPVPLESVCNLEILPLSDYRLQGELKQKQNPQI